MTPDGEFGPVRLRIWGNVATLRNQTTGAELLTREGVSAVGQPRREGQQIRRQVQFADGVVWEVTEPRKGCGCGQ